MCVCAPLGPHTLLGYSTPRPALAVQDDYQTQQSNDENAGTQQRSMPQCLLKLLAVVVPFVMETKEVETIISIFGIRHVLVVSAKNTRPAGNGLARLVHVLCITFVLILNLSQAVESAYSQEQEIAYDDGSAESSNQIGIGGIFVMDFDSPYVPLFLVKARIFFVEAGPFELNVWDCPSDTLACSRVATRTFTAERDGEWFTADLSDAPVRLNGCFSVGVEWTTGGRPRIGLDTNNPRGLSAVWDPVRSKSYRYRDWPNRSSTPDGNFMIRAIVHPAEATVTEPSTGTVVMSSSKTVIAYWRIDYTNLLVAGAIIVTVGAALAVILRRRTGRCENLAQDAKV